MRKFIRALGVISSLVFALVSVGPAAYAQTAIGIAMPICGVSENAAGDTCYCDGGHACQPQPSNLPHCAVSDCARSAQIGAPKPIEPIDNGCVNAPDGKGCLTDSGFSGVCSGGHCFAP